MAVATLVAIVMALWLGRDGLPFNRPSVDSTDVVPNIFGQLVQLAFALFIIRVASRVTPRRSIVDFDERTPARQIARSEMIWLLLYGVVVLFAGGLNGIGMHLHGAIYGPTRAIPPRDVYVWAAYNFLFFAAIPYLAFRKRGYDHRSMFLKSENARGDAILILVVLIIESAGELFTFPGLFSLTARQLLIGIPLTFVLHLVGTGLPVMVFAYALLFPRYMKVTRSPASAIVCGALTYAGLHLFEYWTVYDSLTNGVLSIAFLLLQFTPPGLVKSYLTWRTGNAWVHLWAYHAVAPHVTVDTPHVVKIFGIR
ncbi:MAG TPA: hypothetical protein VFH67_01840 [bacterium]|nr:hypothetical protein [bacterium]